MTKPSNCPVCDCDLTPDLIVESGYNDLSIKCSTCGSFEITGEAREDILGLLTARKKANLSAWLSRNQGYQITTGDHARLKALVAPSIPQRVDLLMRTIAEDATDLRVGVHFKPKWISASWSLDQQESLQLVGYMFEQGYIQNSGLPVNITAQGWKYVTDMQRTNEDSNQCFVAMRFNEKMEQVYGKAIAPAIKLAGYDPLKINDTEHNNKIDDEIIAEIRRSRFLVADFHEQRNGVYYEAGFAHGLGLEVIWTCPSAEIDDLHFDVRQYNCIAWSEDGLEEFEKKLQLRIESVLGKGKNQE